MIIYNIIIL